MKKDKNYSKFFDIQFSGLKLGIHEFEYELEKKFFEHYPYPEIHDAEITANVVMEKRSNMLVLNFDLSGQVTSTCDRCNEDCEVATSLLNEKIIVKFGENQEEESDEIVCIAEGTHTINIAEWLYEFAVVALPLHKTHAEGKCNAEVLAVLEKLQVKDETIDPRWSALKNIKLE